MPKRMVVSFPKSGRSWLRYALELTEGGFRLGVAIADVSHFVSQGDPIDLELCIYRDSTFMVATIGGFICSYIDRACLEMGIPPLHLTPNTIQFGW